MAGGLLRGGFVLALLVLQLGCLIGVASWVRYETLLYYILATGLGFGTMLLLANDHHNMSYRAGWLSLMVLLPISGCVMYFLWGGGFARKYAGAGLRRERELSKRDSEREREVLAGYGERFPAQRRLATYLQRKQFPLTKDNRLSYVPTGEEAFARILEDVRSAKRYIFLCFYIIAEGRLWEQVFQALTQKLAAGVEVCLLYDDLGTMFRVQGDFARRLMEAGAQVRIFNPVHAGLGTLYLNCRNHQKLVVVDGAVAYTGGINLADEYVNYSRPFGYWKDCAIRMEGPVAQSLADEFLQMWNGMFPRLPRKLVSEYESGRFFSETEGYAQFFMDGPAFCDRIGYNVYRSVVESAGEYLYITTPYLIMDEEFREALRYAARSGVDVRVITPGVADKRSVKLLTNYQYGPLLLAGVRIFEYQPGFLHSKLVFHEGVGVIGSVNTDYRSFFLQYEAGVVINDAGVLKQLRADFAQLERDSREITWDSWRRRPLLWKLLQPLLNLVAILF